MKATRTVPARPVNDGENTACKIVGLVADTLDHSPDLDGEAIRTELGRAKPALALLASGGHLRRGELALLAPGLRLRIDVPVGEDALKAVEDTDPPHGAATADEWRVHFPIPDSLASIVRSAANSCPNVSLDAPPDDEPEARSRSLTARIDLSRLTDLKRRS